LACGDAGVAMNGKRLCGFVLALVLLAAPTLRAQAPPNTGGANKGDAQNGNTAKAYAKQGAAAAPPFVLRTETRLVQLNVVVQNRKGKPVAGLKKEDFTLLDNGKPQDIALFASEAAPSRGSVAAGKDGAHTTTEAMETLAPNVFGNRLRHPDEPPGSVAVVLFDALNTSFHDQAYARTQVLAFLRQLQPQDHVAIYLLTTKLKVINEFTQDSKSLLQAIEGFQAMPSLQQANSSEPDVTMKDTGITDPKGAARVAMLLNDVHSKLSDVADAQRVEITARAIEAIANHVSGIPGRKSLVWISGGFPISISLSSNDNSPVDSQAQNFTPQMERVARALNQSNMAIYPVDARGLLLEDVLRPSSAYCPGCNTTLQEGQSEQSTMQLLADRTGGHAFYNTNDIKGAIRRTLADGQHSYEIGYYPDHGTWNGAYHTLALRLKKTGATLRYRKGYFALAYPAETTEAAHNALTGAIWSPVDATSLGIEARIETIYMATRKLELRVKVQAEDLRLKNVDGRHLGKVDAIYMQLGAADAVLGADPLSYSLDMGEAEYQAMLRSGYVLKAPLTIEPGTRDLRVVVRDAGSGLLGSVTVPLERFMPVQGGGN